MVLSLRALPTLSIFIARKFQLLIVWLYEESVFFFNVNDMFAHLRGSEWQSSSSGRVSTRLEESWVLCP